MSLVIHKIHQPDPVIIRVKDAEGVGIGTRTLPMWAGDRVALSYINFFFCNQADIGSFLRLS